MPARLQGYIRDRTRVLAAMSHDLKTPITRLRLRAELLGDGELRSRFTRDLDEMESMVASTLDFLRGLETGEAIKPVDVMALLESLQADMAELGGAVVIEGGAKAPYFGRPQALKRCLANLLENAVKHGKSARAVVDDDGARLEIRIQDEGAGLPQAELEKVFEPFYRVEGSRSRETGGSVTIEGRAASPYPARPQALKRCLHNLVENAIKYGRSASVAVADDAAALVIRIRDEGPGLPAAEIDKVFEPFYRGESSRSRATGGTGLGLTIARSVVEAHGGRIELRNRQAGGLEATLTLPR
jgi:signal transduction histidine kinase